MFRWLVLIHAAEVADATSYACYCQFRWPPASPIVLADGGLVRVAADLETCDPWVLGFDVEPDADPLDSHVDVDFMDGDPDRIGRYHMGDVWSVAVPDGLAVDVVHPMYWEIGCYSSRMSGWYEGVVTAPAEGGDAMQLAWTAVSWERVERSSDRKVSTTWSAEGVAVAGYLVHAWDRVQSEPTLDLWQPLFNADGSQEVVANARWDGPVPRELCLDWELLDPFDQVALIGSEPCRTLRTGCDHTGGAPWTWAVLPALVGLRRRRHASEPGDLTVAIEH